MLGTEELRAWADGRNPAEKPVRSDFVAKNGLRVHVLDDNVFRAHHFDIDRPYAARDHSVVSLLSLHISSLLPDAYKLRRCLSVSSHDLR